MSTRTTRGSFYLTFVLPLIHLFLCVIVAGGGIDTGWILVTWIDFPIGLLLGGLAFRDGNFLAWFGVFGTLWWYGVSWAIWAAWSLLREGQTTAGGKGRLAGGAEPDTAGGKAGASPVAKE